MKILDCETETTTYWSLENLLGISRDKLQSILLSYDRSSDESEPHLSSTTLLSHVMSRTTKSAPHVDSTSWFHLTRAADPQSFNNGGIKPLGDHIGELWALLQLLAEGMGGTPEEWSAFLREFSRDHSGNTTSSRGVHYAKLYALKVSRTKLWGPYALLIRETAFVPRDLGSHDYLAVPEIVEDICVAFKEWTGGDLLGAFVAATRPCIVKFVDDKYETEALPAALQFLYERLIDKPLTQGCNVCFDASGITIPRDRICNIEFISGTSPQACDQEP